MWQYALLHMAGRISVKHESRPLTEFEIKQWSENPEFHPTMDKISLLSQGEEIGSIKFSVAHTKPKGSVQVFYTQIEEAYRGKGYSKILQEALISYLNGLFGVAQYVIDTDISSPAGEATADYRTTLMFNPEEHYIS